MTRRAITETIVRRRLGDNVRALRTGALLTVKKAAERAEMHWRHWQKIEAGHTNVTLYTLVRVADALNTEPGHLLLDPGNRPPQTT
jgi:transcriptional regulator with XRE-family HTH domain